MFFGNPPKMKDFHIVLERIIENIKEVRKIPPEKREYYYG